MRTSLRVAGWGTLGFGLAFFATFAINALINVVLVDYPEHPLASDMAADHWGGAVFLVNWTLCGVALGVAAVGLAASALRPDGIPARVSALFGAVATAGWLLSGASGMAQRTSLLNANIAGAGADPAAERAIVEGLFVGVHSGGILFAAAAVPWLAIAAVGAARRISKTVSVLLWIAALASFAGFVALGAQYGFLIVMADFVLVGVILLRRARRMPEPAGAAVPVGASAGGA
ncbi:hypothetical protein [Microbacterium sp. NPDC056569]|uniref:hypothetical protein n=1 Tax=Microbacterium sp. NPDC056569 TaxID=3345867 RepID=UPI00366DCDEE